MQLLFQLIVTFFSGKFVQDKLTFSAMEKFKIFLVVFLTLVSSILFSALIIGAAMIVGEGMLEGIFATHGCLSLIITGIICLILFSVLLLVLKAPKPKKVVVNAVNPKNSVNKSAFGKVYSSFKSGLAEGKKKSK